MGLIKVEHPLSTGNVIRYFSEVETIRPTPTGVHAKISIYINDYPLASDRFNVEKHDDRVRLANAAAKQLDNVELQLWSPVQMLRTLTAFCDGLWPALMGTLRAIPLSGGAELQPLDFYLRPYIVRGSGTILFAPKGAGKTYMGQLWHRCIESGDARFWQTKQARVLFVQLERSAYTFGRRIHQINRALGMPPEEAMLTLVARGKTLAEIIDVIKRHVEEDGVEVVIVDSISRSGAGALVEDRTANNIMDALNAAAPTWCALAHTSHDGKDTPGKAHVFGSVHFENAADIVVQLTAQAGKPGLLGLLLQVVQANDMPTGHTDLLAFEFDPDLGLRAIRKAGQNEFPELNSVRRMSPSDKLYDFILDRGAMSPTDAAEQLGLPRTTVSDVLRHDERFIQVRKEGKSALYGVHAS